MTEVSGNPGRRSFEDSAREALRGTKVDFDALESGGRGHIKALYDAIDEYYLEGEGRDKMVGILNAFTFLKFLFGMDVAMHLYRGFMMGREFDREAMRMWEELLMGAARHIHTGEVREVDADEAGRIGAEVAVLADELAEATAS